MKDLEEENILKRIVANLTIKIDAIKYVLEKGTAWRQREAVEEAGIKKLRLLVWRN
jgi:hypothetical protein